MLTAFLIVVAQLIPAVPDWQSPQGQKFMRACADEAATKVVDAATFVLTTDSTFKPFGQPTHDVNGLWHWTFTFDGATKTGAIGHYIGVCQHIEDGSVVVEVSPRGIF